MSHYFSNDFQSEKVLSVSGVIGDVSLTLQTGPGIFSYQEFDKGTVLMLEEFTKDFVMDSTPIIGRQVRGNDEGIRVLDLCAGYGLVASYIKKRFPSVDVDAVEVNERACEFAAKNIVANGGSKKNVICKDAGEWLPLQEGQYDVILVNPPFSVGKQFCFGLLEGAYKALDFGGKLYVVVPTKKGAKSYHKKLEDVFSSVKQLCVEGGYRVYRAVKNEK